jgi:hypothetical protein
MTAHELIERCAQICEDAANAHWEAYKSGGMSAYTEGCADTAGAMAMTIRALKATIPDGVICEAEPVAWLLEEGDKSGKYLSFGRPVYFRGSPLYRAAKEPT